MVQKKIAFAIAIGIALLFLFVFVLLSSKSFPGTQKQSASISQEKAVFSKSSSEVLLEIPNDEKVTAVAFTPDGNKFVYNGEKEKRVYIATNKQRGKEYMKILPSSRGNWVAFSSDGDHVGYIAQKTEEEYAVVLDGEEVISSREPTLDIEGFSDDGNQFIYKDTINSYLINGKRPLFSTLPYALMSKPIFSPIGGRIAYKISIGGEKQKDFIVIGGEKQKEYDTAFNPVFSPDGKHVAYSAKNYTSAPSERIADLIVVLDGRETHYDDLPRSDILFTSDSSAILYSAMKDGAWRVTQQEVTGRKSFGPPLSNVKDLALASNNSTAVYSAAKKSSPQISGNKGYVTIGADSTDWQIIKVNLAKNDHYVVASTGSREPLTLTISPDGSRIAYALKSDEGDGYDFFINDKRIGRFDTIQNSFFFSKNGNHSLFVPTLNNKLMLFRDGSLVTTYDMSEFTVTLFPEGLSEDGEHVIYTVSDKSGSIRLLLDGAVISEYNQCLFPYARFFGEHIVFNAICDSKIIRDTFTGLSQLP